MFIEGLSLWALWKFYRNLYHFSVILQRTSIDESPTTLSKRQYNMASLASKYIALFMLANATTFSWMFVFFTLYGYHSVSFNIFGGVAIDCTANVMCLLLQYSFCSGPYDRYCGGKLDKLCKWIILRHMEKAVIRQHVSQLPKLTVDAVSSRSTHLEIAPKSPSSEMDGLDSE